MGFILGLLFIGLFLVLLETLVPGGVIGTVGAVLIVISGILFIQAYGTLAGIAFFIVSGVLGVAIWLSGFLYFARRLSLKPPIGQADAWDGSSLLGARGRVVQALRPIGTIEINAKRYSAQSTDSLVEIPLGEEVMVTGQDGVYLLVEASKTEGNAP